MVGDNNVTLNGDLVHFSLLVGDEPINYGKALKHKKWKATMVEELQVIEIFNAWELIEFPTYINDIEVK